MFNATKTKIKSAFVKFCVAFTLLVLVGVPVGIEAAKHIGVRGDIEFPTVIFGGGSQQHAAMQQQTDQLANAAKKTADQCSHLSPARS